MTKLRIGLIGFGSWVKAAYLPALQYDGRAIIAAATAATEKTRRQIHETLGEGVAIYDSYEALLRQADVDAVMIAVPDAAHEAALSAAMDAGVAVFYEPPITHLRERALIMNSRLLAAPQVTFAHLELGFHPGIARAISLLEGNAIGSLQQVAITLHADWGPSNDSDLCLMNRMACWYVDVLNRITGSLPKRVLALDGFGNPGRMQAVSTAIYDYNGVWGFFRANVASPQDVSITVELTGSAGDIAFDYFSGELRCRSLAHPEGIVETCSPQKPYADWPAVRETVSAFVDAALCKEPSRGNARAIAQLNLIGLATDRSKDTGDWEEIDIL